MKRQILLDDEEDADILIHLLPSISFIEAELAKGRGVLVHCQAGISMLSVILIVSGLSSISGRSATIVAGFLMYTQNVDSQAALEIIRQVRPNVQLVSPNLTMLTLLMINRPNDGFMAQLEIFYKASFRVSSQDKATRMFYMKRTLDEVMSSYLSLIEYRLQFPIIFLQMEMAPLPRLICLRIFLRM
jgi:dual specificity phosphatase 12